MYVGIGAVGSSIMSNLEMKRDSLIVILLTRVYTLGLDDVGVS